MGLLSWIVFKSVKSSSDQRQTAESWLAETSTSLIWLTSNPVTGPRWWSIFVIYSRQGMSKRKKKQNFSKIIPILWTWIYEECMKVILSKNINSRSAKEADFDLCIFRYIWQIAVITWIKRLLADHESAFKAEKQLENVLIASFCPCDVNKATKIVANACYSHPLVDFVYFRIYIHKARREEKAKPKYPFSLY